MRIFEKYYKNRLSIGVSAPEPPHSSGCSAFKPPRCYFHLILQLCRLCFYRSMHFITLKNEQTNSGTCSAFTSSMLLHLFFMTGGAKIFLVPGRRVP